MTGYNCGINTAQNSSDNLPSYARVELVEFSVQLDT